ncbi:PRD domain-containing protein [Thalassobacillus devorans]|uniref:PRD domain-containing protein n=1 Tax=Thalassobacillus devorans TaxID=279813 RepID=UPI000A1CAFEC|nr:PRD domain-containing protein [Thalassobacillus devorans]
MLSEEMVFRLQLLLDSNQISEKSFAVVKEKLENLLKAHTLDADHPSSGPFTNHLAIAVERVNRQEALKDVSKETEELINQNPDLYEKANQILKDCIWQSGAEITRAETGFITLYLAMFQQK